MCGNIRLECARLTLMPSKTQREKIKEIGKIINNFEIRIRSFGGYVHWQGLSLKDYFEDFIPYTFEDRVKANAKTYEDLCGTHLKEYKTHKNKFRKIFFKDSRKEIRKEDRADSKYFYKFFYASSIALLYANIEELFDDILSVFGQRVAVRKKLSSQLKTLTSEGIILKPRIKANLFKIRDVRNMYIHALDKSFAVYEMMKHTKELGGLVDDKIINKQFFDKALKKVFDLTKNIREEIKAIGKS